LAKIRNYQDSIENKNTKIEDSEDVSILMKEVERMIDDPIFEFALENLEKIYNFIEENEYVLEYMVKQINGLRKWEERRESG